MAVCSMVSVVDVGMLVGSCFVKENWRVYGWTGQTREKGKGVKKSYHW